MNGLFKVALKTPYDESDKGLSFKGELIPATPEEIKAAHGKCGTCSYYEPDETYCACPYNYVVAPQPEDYCNHHEPKET